MASLRVDNRCVEGDVRLTSDKFHKVQLKFLSSLLMRISVKEKKSNTSFQDDPHESDLQNVLWEKGLNIYFGEWRMSYKNTWTV